MINFEIVKFRKELPQYKRVCRFGEKNNTINRKIQKQYDYYICDYCAEEIKINVKHDEKNGGIVIFPHSLTKCGELKVVLHNRCLNKALEQAEKIFKGG